MSISELRKQIKARVDAADEATLTRYALMMDLNEKAEIKSLPSYVQEDIEESIKELEAGEGISNSEVMAKARELIREIRQRDAS